MTIAVKAKGARSFLEKMSTKNKIVNRAARRVIDQAKRLYGDLCSDFEWEVNIGEQRCERLCHAGRKDGRLYGHLEGV